MRSTYSLLRCGSAATAPRRRAWYRWGFRRRRVAHLLAEELPPPEDLSRDGLADWILARRKELLSGELDQKISGELAELTSHLQTAGDS
jgi:hypothetical protein